ncbi:MAG: hypothetical protein WCV70_02005 [Patescibacteria group bacterium]|jgi:hypothetical protein
MSQEFNTIISYIKNIEGRYFKALSAFHIFETLIELVDPSAVEQDTLEKNKKIIEKDFSSFFLPLKEALRVYFFLELAKFFDIADNSLHVTKIINYTQSNIAKLSVSDFAEYSQGQDPNFIAMLIREYKGVKYEDILAIQSDIEKNKEIIKRLKTYRDQYLAHDDIKKDEINITGEEIRKLFNIIEKIIDMFLSKLISTNIIYDNAKIDTKDKTKMVVDYLKRFEVYRLKEINELYGLGEEEIRAVEGK